MDDERPSLGTFTEIAANPSRGIADDQVFVQPASHERAPNILIEVAKAAAVPANVVGQVANWVQHGTSHDAAELQQIDEDSAQAARTELRGLWGADRYAENLQAINRYLDTAISPEEAEVLRDGRLADGRALMNDPAMVQRVLGLAKAPSPELRGSIDQQVAEIEKYMRSNRREYSKNEVLQARYRELLQQRLDGED
jgi:hypothetical protein